MRRCERSRKEKGEDGKGVERREGRKIKGVERRKGDKIKRCRKGRIGENGKE